MEEKEGQMIPDEKQIILRLDKLMKFEFDLGKTKVDDLIAWANNILNVLNMILPPENSQRQMLENIIKIYTLGEIYGTTNISDFHVKCRGILKAIHADFNAGFLKDLRAEIRVEVDTDFLSQAQRLLDDKYKDPAAMLIGAVLEDTLRQLCQKHGVSEGANINSMNVPLKTAGAYRLPDQQQVIAWAAIRNNADHGRFDEYNLGQVKLMHQGVLDFVARHLT